jgi:transcription elongation factor GreA-like protein/transcription elongation GreA/GreB family factor
MDETIKTLIAEKNFDRLEDIWLELMEKPETNLKDFFSIAAGIKNVQAAGRAYPLLEILASNFEAAGELRKAAETYKHMTYYTTDHEKIRAKLIELYRELYKDSSHLSEYLRSADLAGSAPVAAAIERLDEFLQFDIGRFFYYEHYGVGSVIDVIPDKREIVLNFEREKRQQFTIVLAKKILTPLPAGHFLYQKSHDRNQLREMALREPGGLIELIVRSFGKPLTAAQIKDYCSGIVNQDEWDGWWGKLKKNLEQDPHIRIGGTSRKTYEYATVAVDRGSEALTVFEKASPEEKYQLAEDYARRHPQVFAGVLSELVKLGNDTCKGNPGLALDILLLCQAENAAGEFSYTVDSVLRDSKPEAIMKNLQNSSHQSFVLKKIQANEPAAWPAVFKRIFFTVDDFDLLGEIKTALRSEPAVLKEIYQDIFLLARNHPHHYHWLLKKLALGELVEFLSPAALGRIITNLDEIKGTKQFATQLLAGENFKLTISQATEPEVRSILAAIEKSKQLADYVKSDLKKIIERIFPQLFKKVEDVIWTTRAALLKKQEELHRLATVDIPQNKNDLSRARGFGDLSENYEYKAAKERERQLHQKFKEIETALKKVKVIDRSQVQTDRVAVGTKVTMKNVETGEAISYTILGRWDIDIEQNIISDQAPIAVNVLLGGKCGDQVRLNDVFYEIVTIEKAV